MAYKFRYDRINMNNSAWLAKVRMFLLCITALSRSVHLCRQVHTNVPGPERENKAQALTHTSSALSWFFLLTCRQSPFPNNYSLSSHVQFSVYVSHFSFCLSMRLAVSNPTALTFTPMIHEALCTFHVTFILKLWHTQTQSRSSPSPLTHRLSLARKHIYSTCTTGSRCC